MPTIATITLLTLLIAAAQIGVMIAVVLITTFGCVLAWCYVCVLAARCALWVARRMERK